MRILSIGTDRKMFEEGSRVLHRSLAYAEKMSEMHMIVFTLKKENYLPIVIGNLHIYPTNSSSEWLYVGDAMKLGGRIIRNNGFIQGSAAISTQDPFQTGFVGARLSKKFQLPFQVQIHTDFLSPYFSRSFLNVIRKIIASFVIPHASNIRVVSEVIKDSLLGAYKNIKGRIDVLPVFVDIEKIVSAPIVKNLQEEFPQFKSIVFMASRLASEKRFDTALRAFKEVLLAHPHTGLIIAGSGPEKENILKLAKKLGIENNVALMGWQDDLISYYKTCDVFLLTSEYEGYGMTLIEAGASGAAIITTEVGIAKTPLFVSGENSLVCQVGDAPGIAKAVISLVDNTEKRKMFGQNMQKAVESSSLSMDEYAVRYVWLIQSMRGN